MKIVCIGDSMVFGFRVRRSKCWVSLLAEALGTEVINKGVNGDTTAGILARFQKDCLEEEPKYVIFDGGWNDFMVGADPGAVQSNIMSMVNQAHHHGIIPILLIVPPGNRIGFKRNWPSFLDYDSSSEQYGRFRQWVLDFCKGFSVHCIDCYEVADTEEFRENRYLDGIHMDAEGHEIVAGFITEKFKQIMEQTADNE